MGTAVETTKKKAPAKKTAGRISPLVNEQVEKELLNLIVLGTPIRKAVTVVGVSEKTFYNWMSRGMAERERLDNDPNAKPNTTEGVYLQFLQSCERARSEAIAKKVAVITQSGVNGDWRAAAWWLERQVPDEFGKTDRVEIGGTNGDAIKVQVEMGDLEDKIAKVLALRKR
jgi:transposase